MVVHVCSFISARERFEVLFGPTQKNYTPHNPLQQYFRQGQEKERQRITNMEPGGSNDAVVVEVDEKKSELQKKIRKNDATIRQKMLQGKSTVLKNFMRVVYNDVDTVYAACKSCMILVKYSPESGTSGLKRHTCSKTSDDQSKITAYIKRKAPPGVKTRLTNKLARMCSQDIRPFALVEGDGFIDVAQELLDIGARYGGTGEGTLVAKEVLPCARTVSRHVEGEYEKVKSLVLEELSEVSCFCFFC